MCITVSSLIIHSGTVKNYRDTHQVKQTEEVIEKKQVVNHYIAHQTLIVFLPQGRTNCFA